LQKDPEGPGLGLFGPVPHPLACWLQGSQKINQNLNKNQQICKFQEGETNFPADADGKTLFSDVDYVDTWPEMEKLVEAGLVKSIGVSNFNSEQIDRVIQVAKIKPAVNQVILQPKKLNFCSIIDLLILGRVPSVLESEKVDGVLQRSQDCHHCLLAAWLSRSPVGETRGPSTLGR